ncbi:MAG: hypothetical protein J7L93_01250 [Thermoplasmata archaeon]|nr:hypothetical protein [Thermoplasmata archaeon]
MRHRLARTLMGKAIGATKWEKSVLVLPFVVLVVDTHIFYYSLVNRAPSIILSSGFVLALSIVEIFAALEEISEHLAYAKKHSSLESRVADVVRQFDSEPTVRQVVERMFSEYPGEDFSRYELYPMVCDVLNDMFPRKGKMR